MPITDTHQAKYKIFLSDKDLGATYILVDETDTHYLFQKERGKGILTLKIDKKTNIVTYVYSSGNELPTTTEATIKGQQ